MLFLFLMPAAHEFVEYSLPKKGSMLFGFGRTTTPDGIFQFWFGSGAGNGNEFRGQLPSLKAPDANYAKATELTKKFCQDNQCAWPLDMQIQEYISSIMVSNFLYVETELNDITPTFIADHIFEDHALYDAKILFAVRMKVIENIIHYTAKQGVTYVDVLDLCVSNILSEVYSNLAVTGGQKSQVLLLVYACPQILIDIVFSEESTDWVSRYAKNLSEYFVVEHELAGDGQSGFCAEELKREKYMQNMLDILEQPENESEKNALNIAITGLRAALIRQNSPTGTTGLQNAKTYR